MKYLFNPENKMAVPFDADLAVRNPSFVKLLNDDEARSAIAGVPTQVIIANRTAKEPEPVATPAPSWMKLGLNINGNVVTSVDISPANKPKEEPKVEEKKPEPEAAPTSEKQETQDDPFAAEKPFYAGLNRDTVKMAHFDKVTDDQLYDFARTVLNLNIDMAPECEDKASIDYQKWVEFARTVIRKQVAKCEKLQKREGK